MNLNRKTQPSDNLVDLIVEPSRADILKKLALNLPSITLTPKTTFRLGDAHERIIFPAQRFHDPG